MGQAKSLAVRQQAIGLKQAGRTHLQIAEELHLGLGTVKNLWKRYLAEGDSGLSASYARCGRRVAHGDEVSFRLVRLLKHLHPSWGIPLILVKVAGKYPCVPLRSARQYQRRLFAGSGKLPPPVLPPPTVLDRSRIAHDAWQIDGKERFFMANGEETCYLTISDEGTGALLGAKAPPTGASLRSPWGRFAPFCSNSSGVGRCPRPSVATMASLSGFPRGTWCQSCRCG